MGEGEREYIVGTMQTSGKMPGCEMRSRFWFEFNKKEVDGVCGTAFSFEIKRRFLLPKPSRRIDSPVGHVGMEKLCQNLFFPVQLVSLSLRISIRRPSLRRSLFLPLSRRLARLFTLILLLFFFFFYFASSSLSFFFFFFFAFFAFKTRFGVGSFFSFFFFFGL